MPLITMVRKLSNFFEAMEGWQLRSNCEGNVTGGSLCFTFFSLFFFEARPPGQIFFVIKYFSIDGNVTN